jgi:hypothetical protein
LDITASELEALQRTITRTTRKRRTSRKGRNAGEHLAAARAVYNRAESLMVLLIRVQ